ncbi:MAG: hypothetical protein VW600_08580 [Ferrovibrio sp.]
MTSERPLRLTVWVLGATWLVMLLAMNSHVPAAVVSDAFGLWHDSGPRRIYTNERLSKYLLARRYVPGNFDGVLMGPSFSANINPQDLAGLRLYNLSINGGNAYEQKHVFEPAAQSGRLKYVVLCLHPYIVKDTGFKARNFSANYLEAALFSREARLIADASIRGISLESPDVFASSEAGWNDFDQLKDRDGYDFRKQVASMANAAPSTAPYKPNTRALQDLRDIVAMARRNNIRIFGFYFPNNIWSFDILYRPTWAEFRRDIDSMFGPEDIIWDMNTPDYDFIRANLNAYSDGHLNRVGARLVAQVLREKLTAARVK